MGNIILARGLSEKELQDIRELENTCNLYEILNMKLNWDMLENRSSEETNDFLYYEGGKLIGFLGMYGFGSKAKEIEITGMVHPEFRCKDIFKLLFLNAKQECITRGAERILLITERASATGTYFVKCAGSIFSFSEFRMKFSEIEVPLSQNPRITFRKAEHRDNPELLQMDSLFFGSPVDEIDPIYLKERYDTSYVAELNGTIIGKIGVLMEGSDGYIFGFSIKPEYQKQGYGRELLSLTLKDMLSKKINTAILEVAVKNDNALLLYKSCGFKEVTVYDYYEVKL